MNLIHILMIWIVHYQLGVDSIDLGIASCHLDFISSATGEYFQATGAELRAGGASRLWMGQMCLPLEIVRARCLQRRPGCWIARITDLWRSLRLSRLPDGLLESRSHRLPFVIILQLWIPARCLGVWIESGSASSAFSVCGSRPQVLRLLGHIGLGYESPTTLCLIKISVFESVVVPLTVL